MWYARVRGEASAQSVQPAACGRQGATMGMWFRAQPVRDAREVDEEEAAESGPASER